MVEREVQSHQPHYKVSKYPLSRSLGLVSPSPGLILSLWLR